MRAFRQAAIDAIPRLDPPPLITKKRMPRALKTTQDMLIASQPSAGSREASSPEESQEEGGQAITPAEEREAAWREAISLVQKEGENGGSPSRALGVPDLIHKENLKPKLNSAYGIVPSPCPENSALRLSLSPGKNCPEHQLQSSMDLSKARISGVESEGHSPDLLSFE